MQYYAICAYGIDDIIYQYQQCLFLNMHRSKHMQHTSTSILYISINLRPTIQKDNVSMLSCGRPKRPRPLLAPQILQSSLEKLFQRLSEGQAGTLKQPNEATWDDVVNQTFD